MCSKKFCLFSEDSFFFKFACLMMVGYVETKTGESSGTTTQRRISEIVSGRITDRKLDENNYL